MLYIVVDVQPSSHVLLLTTPWTAVCQVFLSRTISQICSSSYSLHQWCHPTISSCDTLFSFCPWSYPASGTILMGCLFASDDQNTVASALASVLPVTILGWSPLRLICLISLLSKGLSRVFSSTTVQRHQFFGIPLCLWSSSHNSMWPLGRS